MKLPNRPPVEGFCYRYIGEGEGNGVLQRVVIARPHEVVAVQEASVPRFSWSGSVTEFWENFVFIVGPAPSWQRNTGTTW